MLEIYNQTRTLGFGDKRKRLFTSVVYNNFYSRKKEFSRKRPSWRLKKDFFMDMFFRFKIFIDKVIFQKKNKLLLVDNIESNS